MRSPAPHALIGAISWTIISACSAGPATDSTSGAGGHGSSSSSASTSSSSSSSSSGEGGGGPVATALPMLSLNLHCLRLDGTQYATNAERFAAIASLVASRDIAVIAVQEACERPGEVAIEQLRLAIETATSTSWSSTWGLAHVAWEGTPDQADEGVGILARGTLSDSRIIEHVVQGSLHRVAISATLSPQLSGIRVTSVHFEVFESSARTQQARETAVAALVDTDPTFASIVAGDFNDVENSPTHAAFPAMGYVVVDAGLDPSGIDHLMVHRSVNLRPTLVEKVFLGNDAVSDHPGIFARLEPGAGDAVLPTRIKAKAVVGPNQFLALRGSVMPLSWNLGFPMRQSKAGDFDFVTTEITGDFEFKTLINDSTWQSGPNALGKGGADHTITPSF